MLLNQMSRVCIMQIAWAVRVGSAYLKLFSILIAESPNEDGAALVCASQCFQGCTGCVPAQHKRVSASRQLPCRPSPGMPDLP